jgi:hypothetical protein
MFRIVCLLNALMVIPFGISALIAPAYVFAQFGIAVDAATSGIVRGYGATALGYGIVLLLLRNAEDADDRRAVLSGSLVFNLLEVLLQVPLYANGLASSMIWVTICGHALLAVLSALALVQLGRGRIARS